MQLPTKTSCPRPMLSIALFRQKNIMAIIISKQEKKSYHNKCFDCLLSCGWFLENKCSHQEKVEERLKIHSLVCIEYCRERPTAPEIMTIIIWGEGLGDWGAGSFAKLLVFSNNSRRLKISASLKKTCKSHTEIFKY